MNIILNKKWDANHPEMRILKIHTQNKANGIFDIFFFIIYFFKLLYFIHYSSFSLKPDN